MAARNRDSNDVADVSDEISRRKLTVSLTPAVIGLLEEMADEVTSNKSEMIASSIKIRRFLAEYRKKGYRFYISNPAENHEQEVIFSDLPDVVVSEPSTPGDDQIAGLLASLSANLEELVRSMDSGKARAAIESSRAAGPADLAANFRPLADGKVRAGADAPR